MAVRRLRARSGWRTSRSSRGRTEALCVPARSKGLPRQAGMASETVSPSQSPGTSFSWARGRGSRCAAPDLSGSGGVESCWPTCCGNSTRGHLVGNLAGKPAGPRGASLHGQPDGPRPLPGRSGTGRPSGAPGGAARVPQPGAGQQPEPSESTFQDLDQSAEPPSMMPAAGSFAPNLATTITSAPSSAGAIPVSAADPTQASGAVAPELARLDVRRATEVVVPTATMLGPDRLDQGERGRACRRRRRGGRPDRRRDPPPAGAGADPGHLGVRRLGQPAGRAAAAEQAHRDRLHPHRPARREPPRRRQGAA